MQLYPRVDHKEDSATTEQPLRRPSEARRQPLRAAVRWAGEHPAIIVAVLAVAVGLWAMEASQRAFTYLSDDHDEGLYLLQADAVAHGHVFPPAPRHADAFLPWLSVLRDGKFVLKYAPVHASFLAVGLRVLGSARWSLGLVAAGVVVLTYALAKEVLRDRKLAALAAAFLALSPLFLIQSATFLPYCSNLLLLEAFAYTLLRGLRSKSGAVMATSGLLFGVALFARPFDALLFGLPLGAYFLFHQRHQLRRLLANAGWFGLGTVLPLAAMLVYYRAATGSPFRPPFNLLEPNDTLGFGPRQLLPSQPALPFTPELGWRGVTRHVLLTSFWGFGGLLLVGFFLVALFRRRSGGREPWLALVGATFALGYTFFWGTYGTSLKGGLTSFLGPFYFLPVLACVAILAAKGFGELWRRDWVMTLLAFTGMVMVSGYLLAAALGVNLRLTDEDRRLYTPLKAANLNGALVFVPPMWGPHLLHPFAWLHNAADYDGETVYALDRGEPANLAVLDDYPGRVAYRLHVHGAYRSTPPDPGLTTSLETLAVAEQPSLETTLSFQNPTANPSVGVSVTVNGRKDTYLLDTSSQTGKAYEASIRVTRDGVEFGAPFEAHRTEYEPPDRSITVSIVTSEAADSDSVHTVYQRQFAYEIDGANLRVLLPGVVSVNELGPEPLQLNS